MSQRGVLKLGYVRHYLESLWGPQPPWASSLPRAGDPHIPTARRWPEADPGSRLAEGLCADDLFGKTNVYVSLTFHISDEQQRTSLFWNIF